MCLPAGGGKQKRGPPIRSAADAAYEMYATSRNRGQWRRQLCRRNTLCSPTSSFERGILYLRRRQHLSEYSRSERAIQMIQLGGCTVAVAILATAFSIFVPSTCCKIFFVHKPVYHIWGYCTAMSACFYRQSPNATTLRASASDPWLEPTRTLLKGEPPCM